MRHPRSIKAQVRKLISISLACFMYLCLLPALPSAPPSRASAEPVGDDPPQAQIPVIAAGSAYRQTNLVSDIPGLAFVQDPLLVNPWGLTATGASAFWAANNGTSTSTLYKGGAGGNPVVKNSPLSVVTIPGDKPTGTVANVGGATDFVVSSGAASGKAAFLFSSLTGNISGWNPNVPAAGSTTAVIMSSNAGHVYTGLATGTSGGEFLYAPDFASGKIDVFNSSFVLQPSASFPFADPTIPTTPGNTYHPFNVQNIGGSLYVTYAKVGTGGRSEAGVGNGFVRRFNTAGVRDLTFGINNGALNAPWGAVLAPASFGIFGSALLIGNFGEGNPSIHAYSPTTGAFLGTVQDESGNGIAIDELWALRFGNGGNGGDVNTLYFTAGPAEEEHGLLGSLQPTTASATSLIQFADTDVSIGEGSGHVDITVVRLGNLSGTATINFDTFDESQTDNASQKSDFEIALGKLTFDPGESSKTFRILLVNDLFDENDETIHLALSNPTGAGVGLGSPNVATVKILDNDTGASTTNPIDDATFFVRQHYLDFLNREPDPSGLAFWVNEITSCGSNATCIEVKRINVSAAFFLSGEFQNTGLVAYLANRAAFGSAPLYGRFELDHQALQKGYAVGAPLADAILEANKTAYFNDFVNRPEFVDKYPSSLTNDQYVDNLMASAGISPSNFVVNLTNGQENPPTNPTTTGGARRPASFGTATFSMNPAQTQMTFTATISNLDFTGSQTVDVNDNLVAAHIHAGPSVTPRGK